MKNGADRPNDSTVPPVAPPKADALAARERAVARALQQPAPWAANGAGRVTVVALAAVFGAIAGALTTAGLGHVGATDPDPVTALRESVGTLAMELRTQAATIDRIAAGLDAGPVSHEITGAIPIPPRRPDVAEGWDLRHAEEGRAVVYGGGSFREVFPGSQIPGLGFVLRIARDRLGWFVSTENGVIVSIRG